MTVRVSCPFCNTTFDLGSLGSSGRVNCPRCGEAFPVKGDAGLAVPQFSENGTSQPTLENQPPSTVKSFRSLALLGGISAVVIISAGLYCNPPRAREAARG